MTARNFVVAALAGLMMSAGASAATYYVAQQDPKSADTNAGTLEAPFKTIGQALKGFKPGDTLWIKKGTYRETFSLRKEVWQGQPAFGTTDSFIHKTTIAAWPGDEVFIKGSDLLTKWTVHKDKIYVTEEAFNPGLFAMLFCDGKMMELIGDGGGDLVERLKGWGGGADVGIKDWRGVKEGTQADLKAGQYYYDKAAKKLYAWLPDGGDPAKHTMEVAVREGVFIGTDYVHVSGLKFYHSGLVGLYVRGNYNIVEDCDVMDGAWSGLGVTGKYNTFLRCKFNHHGNTGICGNGEGHKFINCETSYNNYLLINGEWNAGGVKMIATLRNIVFDGHVASYNYASVGIWFDSWNSQVTVQNSVCHHNGRDGIMYEISTRGTFANNICYANGGRGVYLSNSSDCIVYGNVFYHNGMSGLTCIGTDRPGGQFGDDEKNRLPAGNNVVWGNVFVDNCYPGLCPKEDDAREKSWDTRAELIMPEQADLNTGNVSDYNIYYRSPNRVMPFWKGWGLPPGQMWDDLAAWQKGTGMDTHSIVAKPLFVDAAKCDFRPAKGSPAIDFVKPRMGFAYDINGDMRPNAEAPNGNKPVRWTAGPYEYKLPAN